MFYKAEFCHISMALTLKTRGAQDAPCGMIRYAVNVLSLGEVLEKSVPSNTVEVFYLLFRL